MGDARKARCASAAVTGTGSGKLREPFGAAAAVDGASVPGAEPQGAAAFTYL